MIKRIIEKDLLSALKTFPAVVLTGPRQIGKTTLAKSTVLKRKNALYLDLELPSSLQKLSEPEDFLRSNSSKLIILDEIQRKPELYPIIRGLIDENRKPGRFLLLGSASGKIIRQSSESLAGRVKYMEMSPFHLFEIKGNINKHWHRGGFPESYLAKNEMESREWVDSFMQIFLERDLPYYEKKITPELMVRLFQMLAHIHGNVLNISELARSLDLNPPTISNYIDILENAMLIRRLQPYYINTKKRIIKSPKLFIRDSGILHHILNIPDHTSIYGHPKMGSSWEGYVIEQISQILPNHCKLYFYRTQKGAEIDLLIHFGTDVIRAVEIKHSSSPNLKKGFYFAWEDIGKPNATIIYPGNDSYPLKDGITVSSLSNYLTHEDFDKE